MRTILMALLLLLVHPGYSRDYQIDFNSEAMQLRLSYQGKVVFQTKHSSKADLNSFTILPSTGPWQTIERLISREDTKDRTIFHTRTNKGLSVDIIFEFHSDFFVITLKTAFHCREIRINSDIKSGGHWYGEGETVSRVGIFPLIRGQMEQYWPLSRGQIKRKKFSTTDNSSVLVPVWFSSTGVALFSDSYHYLNERFNLGHNGVFSLGMIEHSVTRPLNKSFSLTVIVKENIVEAYKSWLHNDFIHKPAWNSNNPLPPYEMFEAPIWTTWAKFKSDVNQEKILSFAGEIKASGMPYKILEIDDRWQQNYGDIEFDIERFTDPKQMVDQLRLQDFAVTLWIPPFVNKKSKMFRSVKKGNTLVRNRKEKIHLTAWWESLYLSKNSSLFNFFDTDVQKWFVDTVSDFSERYGILGIKYDAGEAVYLPESFSNHPNRYVDRYIEKWRQMKAVEFRSATFSQHHAPIVREFDKNSTWDNFTGLKSVLTQALAIGMVGYPFVLPDMVGGNQYIFSNLSDELYIRWIQLNAFMPMIQLSLAPWEFSDQTLEISTKYLKTHQELVPYIWSEVKNSTQTGLPIIRPLFFEYPADEKCYSIDDQFFLGKKYLIAPVLEQGKVVRDVYLPQGFWKDFWSQQLFEGPLHLKNIPAPLEHIPVFVRVK